MVWPTLSYLEEIGCAMVEAEGTKKLYRIAPESRRHLEENRVAVEATLNELERSGSRMEYVRRAFADRKLAGDETYGFMPDSAFFGGALGRAPQDVPLMAC